MRKIYTLIIILGLIVSSCSLDQEPTTFLTDDNFYQTTDDMDAAVLHAYQTMTFLDYLRPYMNIPTTASEEAFPKEGEGLNIDQFDEFNVDDRNQNLEQFFRLSYVGLNRANTVIEKTRNSDFEDRDKNKFIGEALFLRSWHHFMLVRLFGEIPIQEKAIDQLSEVFGAKNASIEEIYTVLIRDLKEAISLLQIERSGGRADKVAAQSLLAKVYLTIASSKNYSSPGFNWVSDANTYYNLASEMAFFVINGQAEYTFDNDLQHIFDVSTPEAFNGPEHIFFIPQDRNGLIEGEFSKLSRFFIPANAPTTSYTKDNIKLHGGFGVYVAELSFINSFDLNDKRKKDLIIEELFDENGNQLWVPTGGESQPFTGKYLDPNFIGDNTSTHPYLIRYTDVLLMYAEAQGPTASGYEAINRVRARAELLPLNPGLSEADFREKVLEERAFELAFEGHRLYDLRRTNKIEAVLNGIYGKTLSTGLYFFPIPAIEKELND